MERKKDGLTNPGTSMGPEILDTDIQQLATKTTLSCKPQGYSGSPLQSRDHEKAKGKVV